MLSTLYTDSCPALLTVISLEQPRYRNKHSLLMDRYGLKNHGAYSQWDFYLAFKKKMLTSETIWINSEDLRVNKPDTER